jgi:hypothetical protein
MYGIFVIVGGFVVVENGVADAICAYYGAEDEADRFCMLNGIDLRTYHYVNGCESANYLLDAWRPSMPEFMR